MISATQPTRVLGNTPPPDPMTEAVFPLPTETVLPAPTVSPAPLTAEFVFVVFFATTVFVVFLLLVFV